MRCKKVEAFAPCGELDKFFERYFKERYYTLDMVTQKRFYFTYNSIAIVIIGKLGYTLNNNSLFWGIVDGLFYPIAFVKWIFCEQLTLTLVKNAFPFFFN